MSEATAAPSPGDLYESMRFDPIDGLCFVERHLARLSAAAGTLGFAFDRHEARNALQAATFRLDDAACVRLLVARSGALAIETRALPPPPHAPVTVALVVADAPRTPRTTATRPPPAAPSTPETLFVTPDGLVTRGSATSLFAPGPARLRTPPQQPGILRDELIATGRAEEAVLRVGDLAGGFFVGNALIGLMPAILA